MSVALLGLPSGAAAQAVYSAYAGGVFLANSPTPVSDSGGTADLGGSAKADTTLGAETHAYAAATNSLARSDTAWSALAIGDYQDIVISGPAPTADVTLHLPFHANFITRWSTWGGAITFRSSTSHSVQFVGALIGTTSGQEVGSFDVESLNRADNIFDVRIPQQTAGGAETHQFTQVFYNETPVTSDPSFGTYTGFLIDETLELRGEVTLTGTVPVGVPLRLYLYMDMNTGGHSFFIASARGSTDGRDTFGVPQGGVPVFDLPAGFTANSASLGIFNNVVAGDSAKCPQPQGYWKNNPGIWPGPLPTLGGKAYTQTELLTILKMSVGSGPNADASLILADQLIAAKLNVSNGSDPAPVNAAIATADTLLGGFSGKLPYKVKPSSAIGKQLTAAATALESYNTQQLTAVCRP